MVEERLDTDVVMAENPRNGYEAYSMIIASLSMEIEGKQKILTEMLDEGVKQQFIESWHPRLSNVNIHVWDGDL